jgi:transaldolase
LALDDVRNAADILRGVYDQSGGRDGFVSFECTPDLADDTDATIEQAQMLWDRLERPNVMIKVPATAAGLGAIEELTGRGVNVNITLLFARSRYDEVIEAYLAGLERRVAAGDSVDTVSSVASFFVSGVDAKTDEQLPQASPLRGRVAIATGRLAYQLYEHRFSDERWNALALRALVPSGRCGPVPYEEFRVFGRDVCRGTRRSRCREHHARQDDAGVRRPRTHPPNRRCGHQRRP